MDEPTNHLDLDIIEWLEGYIKSFRGAVVCVSHDKAFLQSISDKVFWLDRGRLKVCPRGFSYFEEWSEMLLEQEERELQNRAKVLEYEVEWASRGVKARRKRNVRRLELMKQERDKLRVDKNALARMLAKIQIAPLELEEASSKMVVQFHNVSKSYIEDGREKIILEKFGLRIQRGDRIGIVGKNGSGKTSFLRMMVGEMAPDTGTVKLAKEITYSYFDQKRKGLLGDHTLHRFLCPNGSDYIEVMGKSRHICGYLKDFLFDPRMAYQPVNTLSGGQKNRLMLSKILANPGSLLILDEPTNDLDMDTLDMLEDMLASYKGTLLVVSHDRDFLDQTVSKILAFEGNGIVEAAIGGYQDYIDARKARNAPTEAAQNDSSNSKRKQNNTNGNDGKTSAGRFTYKQQYEFETLPVKVAALEKEIADIESILADPDFYTKDATGFKQFSGRLVTAKHELELAEHRWLELDQQHAAMTSTGGES